MSHTAAYGYLSLLRNKEVGSQCAKSVYCPVMLLALQVFLERRIRGASVAAHAVYHDEEYFKEVTGLSDVKYIYCKRTETLVGC